MGDCWKNSDKVDNLTQVKKSVQDGNLSEFVVENDGMFVKDDKEPIVNNILEDESIAKYKKDANNQTNFEDNGGEKIQVNGNLHVEKVTQDDIKSKVYQDALETSERETTSNPKNSQGKAYFETHSKEIENGQTNGSIQASVSTVKDSSRAKESKSRKLPGQPSKDDIPSSTLKTADYTKSSKQKISAQKFTCFFPNKTQTKVSIIVYYSNFVLSEFICFR